MNAAQQQSFDEGLAHLARLLEVPKERRSVDTEADVFDKVRRTLNSARCDATAIGSLSDTTASTLLHFVAEWAIKRKASRARVIECLKFLLSTRRCWDVVSGDADLQKLIKSVVGDNAEMLVLLEARPEPEDEAVAPPVRATSRVDVAGPNGSDGIREQLRLGASVMRQFGWKFPTNPLGTDLDAATSGFASFFSAVQRLGTDLERSPGARLHPDVDVLLEPYNQEWPDILAFLASMYRLQSRRSFGSRITVVVHNLWKLSPQFREVLEDKEVDELPWLTDAGMQRSVSV
mmetsp:Transcript_14569/g.31909  ORF Transcript_14569/g.31909 Transcript_14569/m.31909 type:complete len:290 (-) Transcript_14569:122-991(-)|eukprot:CAMPEP_0170631006 /NCGR_PEP_ID=MMETSP0224-20130122/34356_1 /TAXON_ID=285029 /ORGANISM="Togula jolla, Strain CCCM 725" /LENGTH=289 /DNA_ID=CAMNT_0010959207 /DNA_START=39 /DNA_END=908 /DNA_ORIENTATION=-